MQFRSRLRPSWRREISAFNNSWQFCVVATVLDGGIISAAAPPRFGAYNVWPASLPWACRRPNGNSRTCKFVRGWVLRFFETCGRSTKFDYRCCRRHRPLLARWPFLPPFCNRSPSLLCFFLRRPSLPGPSGRPWIRANSRSFLHSLFLVLSRSTTYVVPFWYSRTFNTFAKRSSDTCYARVSLSLRDVSLHYTHYKNADGLLCCALYFDCVWLCSSYDFLRVCLFAFFCTKQIICFSERCSLFQT